MTPKQLMIADGAPKALFMTAEQRRKAWNGVAVRAMPLFQATPKNETPETVAFRAAEDERRRLKSLAGIQRMKNRFAAKAIDYSKMRWDARRNKFVPLTGDKPVTQSAPGPAATPYKPASSPDRKAAKAGADTGPRVTKDNAETVAKLNGVWKPEYEKLRGTGRIVMTVGNVLKGLAKRGGTVKWQ